MPKITKKKHPLGVPLTIYVEKALAKEIRIRAKANNDTQSRYLRRKLERGLKGLLPIDRLPAVMESLLQRIADTQRLLAKQKPNSPVAQQLEGILEALLKTVVIVRGDNV